MSDNSRPKRKLPLFLTDPEGERQRQLLRQREKKRQDKLRPPGFHDTRQWLEKFKDSELKALCTIHGIDFYDEYNTAPKTIQLYHYLRKNNTLRQVLYELYGGPKFYKVRAAIELHKNWMCHGRIETDNKTVDKRIQSIWNTHRLWKIEEQRDTTLATLWHLLELALEWPADALDQIEHAKSKGGWGAT
jgi:NADH:ubiquinone oxidoreductase subunit C